MKTLVNSIQESLICDMNLKDRYTRVFNNCWGISNNTNMKKLDDGLYIITGSFFRSTDNIIFDWLNSNNYSGISYIIDGNPKSLTDYVENTMHMCITNNTDITIEALNLITCNYKDKDYIVVCDNRWLTTNN